MLVGIILSSNNFHKQFIGLYYAIYHSLVKVSEICYSKNSTLLDCIVTLLFRGGFQMKLSKKLTTLAIVGAMSATAAVASAANIGLVNMSQVVNSYPGYGALDMKMQQVDAQYRPQIEKKVQEIEKIKDSAQAEAEFNKTVAPLLQKENEEINKIAQPMMQAIHNTVEAIRVEKQMDVVLDDPYTIRAADANSKIENITNEVISRLKK